MVRSKKRPLESPLNEERSRKKRQSLSPDEEEALETLCQHANDLSTCVQKLKEGNSSRSRAIRHIQKVSKLLLPALEALSKDSATPEAAQGNEGSGQEKVTDTDTKGNATTALSKGTSSLSQDHQSDAKSVPAPPAIPITSLVNLPPFLPEDIPTSKPPLPLIRNPALHRAVFTHSGAPSGQGTLRNYERLEWLGDAFVEMIASVLLFKSFGELKVGRVSQLREMLVRNSTLGRFSAMYEFMTKVEIPKSVQDRTKIPGDIFEAYVAAVILSDPDDGLLRASLWLRELFSQELADQIRQASGKHVSEEDTYSLPAKVLLLQQIGAPGITLTYKDDPSGPKHDKYNAKLIVYTVNLYMDGWGEKHKWLGTGTGLSKKDAGQKAAEMALKNHGLIKTYSQKKAAFLEARAAAQNEEDALALDPE